MEAVQDRGRSTPRRSCRAGTKSDLPTSRTWLLRGWGLLRVFGGGCRQRLQGSHSSWLFPPRFVYTWKISLFLWISPRIWISPELLLDGRSFLLHLLLGTPRPAVTIIRVEFKRNKTNDHSKKDNNHLAKLEQLKYWKIVQKYNLHFHRQLFYTH